MRKLLLCFCAGIIMYASGYTVPGDSSSFYQSTSYSASSGLYKNGGLVYSIPGEYNSSDRGEYYLGVKYTCQVHDFMYGDFYTYAVWLPQAWTGNAPSGRFVAPSRVNNHDIVGLGGGALSGSEITTLVCNSNIRVIMSEACKDCKRLESIELPSTINEISYGVFKGCIELKKIDIPINVTKIGGEAFYGCSKLTTVSLSAKITDVGKDAFSACSAMDSVTFAGTKPTGIDKCGIREECWINISKSNYSAWKDCGYRLLVTQTAIDPSSAIKLRKSLANQMDGITTIVSEVDDATISEVINGTMVPVTRRDSAILYISNAGTAYSVKFNANGGTGTMANQSFVYGTAQNLTANGFSRDGYSFVGWATSATGAKVYSNKESVKNLTTTANGIVNLYAVWKCQASIENISARQRYPWNGLVDLEFTITGTSGIKYDAIFTAKDMIGNTNVAMKTICKADGTSIVATEPLLSGTYNWIWDAAADLPKDFKCDRMTISAIAATGVSPEFKMDLSGMGSWDVRTAAATESICYSSTWATNTLDGAKAVVKVYPVKREKPKYIAINLSGGTAATHYPIEYLDEIPGGSWSDEYKTSKLVLCHIPAGSFIMGGRNTDYPGAVNTNLHMVTLTKDFYMGVFEVTQRQWELVMGNRPSAASNTLYYAMRPVEMVSYMDIRGDNDGQNWPTNSNVDEESFMGVIRRKTFLTSWDLPTSAQWEYACRAGTDTGLNSGKNALYRTGVDENASEVARYSSNSGQSSTTYDLGGDTSTCTAIVGSYLPNNYGLFDMHGNVHERVLDGAAMSTESIDPVGSDLRNLRWCRGGGWQSAQYVIVAGNCSSWTPQRRTEHHGFRLCLQGGEIPKITEGVTLVNAAGSGTANWTPTKAGMYYLTHETQTNGVNGAEVLGAWFTVGAPELTFEPDGDFTPGVKVAIAGVGEGWTVRYTTDGAVPTSSSAEYTGPITLNDSATIRAVAFSDGGLESLEYSATFSLMSVGGAVAKPRYPWNGKVDIDVTVKGAENEYSLVSLVARDLDGGTNLPLRTAWQAGGTITNNAFLVKPGAHRFTWDAAVDITNDCEFANVVVSVLAEHSAIIAAKKVLTLEAAGYAGAETLTNVPVLVRLSTAITGFSYADFVDAKGGDLIFTDESGSMIYPHEIDEWHTDGESLVWVKLPRMANGTKFKMAYGNSQLITHNSQLSSHEVWRDYAGVWHMNEDSGTAYDSTANGLDGIPSKGTNELADISQMVAYENGACGRARVNGTVQIWCGNYLMVPSYDALKLEDNFSVSIWVNGARVNNYYPKLISRKVFWRDENGWELLIESESRGLRIFGSSDRILRTDMPDMITAWMNVQLVYDANIVSCYTNGIFAMSETIAPVVDNGLPLCFGCNSSDDSISTFCGQYDEIRLRGGSLSADRIKADYDMIVNRNFLRYGPVENGKGVME